MMVHNRYMAISKMLPFIGVSMNRPSLSARTNTVISSSPTNMLVTS